MKIIGAALAAIASIAAAPAADSRIADFRVGGVSFALPMPEGYCLPIDRQADVAQLLASLDTENVTDLTLMPCNGSLNKGTNDYTVIKTPRTALMASISRPALLAQVGKEFDSPATTADLKSGKTMAPAEDAFSNLTGMKVKLTGDFVPRGKDEVCGYLAGVLRYNSPVLSYDQPLAGCITSVGNRVLYIYRAGMKTDDASILQLMRETRAMALSIKTISGT